nr:MAG TPA: hypothetical protein [Caudoviricetes sp.]
MATVFVSTQSLFIKISILHQAKKMVWNFCIFYVFLIGLFKMQTGQLPNATLANDSWPLSYIRPNLILNLVLFLQPTQFSCKILPHTLKYYYKTITKADDTYVAK